MRGIQFFHYKSLQETLNKMLEGQPSDLPCGHLDTIIEHQEKLKQIYADYQKAFEDVSLIAMQFDQHKVAISRLVSLHKNCKKSSMKRILQLQESK